MPPPIPALIPCSRIPQRRLHRIGCSTSATASPRNCCVSSRCWSRRLAVKRSRTSNRCSPVMLLRRLRIHRLWNTGLASSLQHQLSLVLISLQNGLFVFTGFKSTDLVSHPFLKPCRHHQGLDCSRRVLLPHDWLTRIVCRECDAFVGL